MVEKCWTFIENRLDMLKMLKCQNFRKEKKLETNWWYILGGQWGKEEKEINFSTFFESL